jgi:hypothetical protein
MVMGIQCNGKSIQLFKGRWAWRIDVGASRGVMTEPPEVLK